MLNDILKDRLSAIDDILLQAIMEVFNEEVEKSKPAIGNDGNNILGEKYRSYILCQTILNGAFNEIKSYKVSNVKPKSFNKER